MVQINVLIHEVSGSVNRIAQAHRKICEFRNLINHRSSRVNLNSNNEI